ncbi:MAG: LytS/YhcK type 5TM receptor domain-containing protein [Candidatus Methylumidiphilus sp.]
MLPARGFVKIAVTLTYPDQPMAFFNDTLLLNWLDFIILLVPKVCVVVVAAFVLIRLRWVRQTLRGVETSWFHRLTMMLVFGGLAIFATHSGILVNVGQGLSIVAEWPAAGLENNQALVGFRDTMVMAGGLIGGPWVGMGAGLLAGFERYRLGGFAGSASGAATLVLGVLAGWARQRRPHGATTTQGAFIVALFGTTLHRLLIFIIPKPENWAIVLGLNIVIPVAVVNCVGCVLFIWVVRDLDRDILEAEVREALLMKQEAELRTLHAQVEPHFLSNTLSAIRALIRRDPDLAREYVVKLADFFCATRKSASANTTSLREELEQLGRYMDFQQLRFGEKIHYLPAAIPSGLLDCQLPPRSLLSLAENALTHGRSGRPEGLTLQIEAVDQGDCFVLRVTDDGRGIAPERLATLGQKEVDSPHSNGTALYQLTKSLALTYGSPASLSITSQPGAGTVVLLTLPKLRSDGR